MISCFTSSSTDPMTYFLLSKITPLTASNDNVEHGKYDNPANADRNRRGAIAPADVWPYHRYVESRRPLLESSQTRHTRPCMPVARQARAAEAGTLRAGAHASK